MVAGTVMQPTGRPFGDVERAALATERLMLLDGGVSSMHARDLGVLRFHQGRYADALSLLKGYLDSPAGKAAEEDAAVPAATILVALPQEAPPTVTDRAVRVSVCAGCCLGCSAVSVALHLGGVYAADAPRKGLQFLSTAHPLRSMHVAELPLLFPDHLLALQTAKEEVAAVRDLVLRLERLQLEGLYNKPTESKEIE